MSEFTSQEISKIKEERGLNQDQVSALQRLSAQYKGKISKNDLLDNFRRFGYMSNLLEEDLKSKFTNKKEKPVKISYDLLPSGKV